jgi:ASC-1-like (ASCH) protein
MTETAAARVRELNLCRRYFDLIAAGRKTIEVRVRYAPLEDLAPGDESASASRARTRPAMSA